MTQKLYQDMSAEEQALWVQDFAQVMEQHGERLALLTKGKTTAATVPDRSRAGLPVPSIPGDSIADTSAIRRLFTLLAAWPFAQDFCDKAQRYGDYMARTSRLPIYIEKVKERLAEGLTMTDADGRVVAYVSPSTPMRRRGRPTKEEVAARLRGEALTENGQGDDAESKKRRTIAALLGLQVVVHGDAPREKNNAELKAERDAKKAEEARMNPSLFAPAESAPTEQPAPASATVPADSVSGSSPSPCAQLMSDSYEMRMAQDKLHLNQLTWLLSPELAKRTETVQSLRVTAESASERAKTLADLGQPADAIAPYAQQAKEATEAYLAIYAAVDEELAVLHKRLYLDLPFVEKFKTRFKGVDIEKVQYITRPYYEKVKSPELDLRIKTIIEQENPEYAAKMKAEQEKKEEVSDLLRYLKRKDKPNVKQRIETMEKRYQRLIELLGEDEARVYRPIVDAAIADYEANFKAKDEAKAAKKAPAEPAPTEKKSDKTASKREQGDAGISPAEREQARPQVKKESKKSTKEETKKPKKGGK